LPSKDGVEPPGTRKGMSASFKIEVIAFILLNNYMLSFLYYESSIID
jgi:hypothetical protein